VVDEAATLSSVKVTRIEIKEKSPPAELTRESFTGLKEAALQRVAARHLRAPSGSRIATTGEERSSPGGIGAGRGR